MHDGASRTAEIVKSLRIFSRVDEDAVMKADINLGIESTLVILGSLLSENIQLDKKLGNLPQIECYPGKLNQVFLNILTNGIYAVEKKFNNKPGGIIKIESTLIADEGFVQILIEDNGIGIPSAVINKIFEPFFTTKDVGEGTGLGMSIAYNTVLKHNGELIVSSVEGEKTTFIIKRCIDCIVCIGTTIISLQPRLYAMRRLQCEERQTSLFCQVWRQDYARRITTGIVDQHR